MKYRDELKKELLNKALKFGDFTLASGQKSSYYINCEPVTLSSKGSFLVGHCLLDLVPNEATSVGGLTLGADPIISSMTVLSYSNSHAIDGFIVRKEAKGHGTQNQIENCPKKGSKVVIVDDVITTGGSALKACEVAQQCGLIVLKAICVVDRQSGGEEAFSKLGVPLESVFKIEEFLDQ